MLQNNKRSTKYTETETQFGLKGQDIIVKNNILKGPQGYQTILSKDPINSWFEVTCIQGTGVRVGISPNQYDDLNILDYPVGMHACQYSYRFKDGNIFNDGYSKQYGVHIKPYDKLRIYYNPTKHTLEYSVNGESQGIAFIDIAPLEYYAAISLYDSAEVQANLRGPNMELSQ